MRLSEAIECKHRPTDCHACYEENNSPDIWPMTLQKLHKIRTLIMDKISFERDQNFTAVLENQCGKYNIRPLLSTATCPYTLSQIAGVGTDSSLLLATAMDLIRIYIRK